MSKPKANPSGGKSAPDFSAMPNSHRGYSSHPKPRKNNDVGKIVAAITVVGIVLALYYMFFGPQKPTQQLNLQNRSAGAPLTPDLADSASQTPIIAKPAGKNDFEIALPASIKEGENSGEIAFKNDPPINAKVKLTPSSKRVTTNNVINISDYSRKVEFKFNVSASTSINPEKLTIEADLMDSKGKSLSNFVSNEVSLPFAGVSTKLQSVGEVKPGKNKVDTKSEVTQASKTFDWKTPTTIASLLISIISLSLALFSYLDKSKYANLARKYELDRVERNLNDEIVELKKRIQSLTPSTTDPIPVSNEIESLGKDLRRQINSLNVELRGEIGHIQGQLDTRISHLSRKLDELRTYKPEPLSEPVDLPETSVDKVVLTDDEQQILGNLRVELNQPEVYYGRVCLCTKGWNTFGQPLKAEIRKSLNASGVQIIEPVRGEPVNRTTMSFDFLPESYRMVVNDTVMLGLRVHDTGDVFKAKVIVE